MNIAGKYLEAGFAEFMRIHGEVFVCDGIPIRGNLRILEEDPLDYVDNLNPRGRVEIWLLASARVLANPFRRGEYLYRGNLRYKILRVTPPDGVPKFWKVIAEVDKVKEDKNDGSNGD